MPELLRTVKTDHHHIVYLRDDGTGETSATPDGHSHIVTLQPPTEPQQPPTPVVEAGGEDLHGHELEEYTITVSDPEGDEKTTLQEAAEVFFGALDFEKMSREEGQEAEQIYTGEGQWNPKKKKELEAKRRAAVTINKVEQKIDNLTGYQKQNRTEIKYLPMEGGDEIVAELLSICTKNILEQCFYPREESKAFEDQALAGRGLLHDYVDYERNIEGDIIVEKWPWDQAAFGEHDKEDLSDCEVVAKWKWFTKTKLEQMYPDKKDKLEPESRTISGVQEESEDWDKRMSTSDMVDVAAKRYRVVELWRKEYERVTILANAEDGYVHNAAGWSKADIKAATTIAAFSAIPRTAYKMRVTLFCATVLLEDYYEESDDYSITPLYAKLRRNKFWGKIRGVKDLQFLINKTYSQFIDIINKVANYGWFYDANTFTSKTEKNKFLKNASSPGFAQEVDDISRLPVKAEGVKFPSEIINALAGFNADLREIMNINLESLGLEGGAESGVAIRQKIVQQLLGNDYLFDNLSFGKTLLGRKVIRRIQQTYTAERILRIVEDQNRRTAVELPARGVQAQAPPPLPAGPDGQPGEQPPAPTQVPLEKYPREELLKLLQEADLSRYDVISSESASSPSVMMGNFLLMSEMAAKGMAIPPEAILEFAPIPKAQKEKIAQMLAGAAAAAKAAEDKKYDTEIIKTRINQEGKTPPAQV
jgi:hypothetical protein